jgi:hypothetical protein
MKCIGSVVVFFIVSVASVALSSVDAQSISRKAPIIRPSLTSYSVTVLPLDSATGMANGIIIGRANGVGVTYVNGQVTPLPSKPSYTNMWPTAIAPNGYIVGYATSGNNTRGLFWPSMTNTPYDMGALGSITTPTAVNSQGQAVGSSRQSTITDLPQAFSWSLYSGMRSIAPPGTNQSQAFDISESGYVAGVAWFGGSQAVIRWLPSTFAFRVVAYTDIGLQALENGSVYSYTTLWDLNNSATVITPTMASSISQISAVGRKVGFNFFDEPGARAWTVAPNSATLQFLPVPSGTLRSYAYQVDACGNILGALLYTDGTEHAALWSKLLCDPLPVYQP